MERALQARARVVGDMWGSRPEPNELDSLDDDNLIERYLPDENRLGRAARTELRGNLVRAVAWCRRHFDPQKGTWEEFAGSVLWKARRELRRKHGDNLERELNDQQRRERAQNNERALTYYLNHWTGRVGRFQRLFQHSKGRDSWHIPDMSNEDVRGFILQRLLEAIREPAQFEKFERTGDEASWRFILRVKDQLRQRRRLHVATDPLDLQALPSSAPSPEQILASEATTAERTSAVRAVGSQLSRTNQRWFAAMEADVRWNESLNLARVARQLGKDRSSAMRAREKIKDILKMMLGDE